MGNTKEFSQLTKKLRNAITKRGEGSHRKLYNRFLDALYHRIQSFKGLTEAQRVTVLTETVLKIQEKIVMGEYEERGSFLSYCGKIAHNMWKKERKKAFTHQKKYSDSGSVIVQDYMEKNDNQDNKYPTKWEKLEKAFPKLKEEEKALIDAYYIHNATAKELAEEQHTTAVNIRQRIYSLKQKLIKYSQI